MVVEIVLDGRVLSTQVLPDELDDTSAKMQALKLAIERNEVGLSESFRVSFRAKRKTERTSDG
jgi:hypothetical protein